MSSGFVSGGTSDAPIERSDEWLAAQQEIEANRQRKAAEARQSSGKSLFETLEANKAAKQEAFEEANRLKNQFRALDEDEVEFLDSVLESTRAEEARVKKETAEGLELFRKHQEDADKKARTVSDAPETSFTAEGEEQWVPGGRKRKRAKEKDVMKGVKVRRSSTIESTKLSAAETTSSPGTLAAAPQKQLDGADVTKPAEKDSVEPRSKPSAHPESTTTAPPSTIAPSTATAPPKSTFVLVDYGSDEDDY